MAARGLAMRRGGDPGEACASRRVGAGVLQDDDEDDSCLATGSASSSGDAASSSTALPAYDPPAGIVLRLAELSNCDVDAAREALVATAGNLEAAMARLRGEGPSSSTLAASAGDARASIHMRRALAMLEDARGRGLSIGGVVRLLLGCAWVAASTLLGAMENVVPPRFLRIFAVTLGLREDGPLGLPALLAPPVVAVLLLIVVLRDLDGLINS
eukprot:TRINITY_DN54555_c0_g1_i1.p1 TRINITY_DN54555_c0_g1~~TRINITY_DN54555_c0_g1_i1.p1  ORF type:complete len:214 (+),score=45.31 TRINITY_DN54555_c0_g1_i1:208-849(+)